MTERELVEANERARLGDLRARQRLVEEVLDEVEFRRRGKRVFPHPLASFPRRLRGWLPNDDGG